jgi:hypothetical protein
MTLFTKIVHELGPNQPGATYDYDFHIALLSLVARNSGECSSALRIRITFKAHPCENVANVY